MCTQSVNLDTYSLSLLTAKEDILNPRSSTNWALFAYDGVTNKLKLADSGAGGVAELAGKFHISKPQYGLCKVGSVETGAPRIAMISWVGPNVDDYRRTECASHIPAIKNFFKEAHAFIKAEKVEDVSEDKIRAEISKAQAQTPTQWVRRSSRSADKEELVGTNYRKTNAAMEMRLINRDSFWARAEREEEQRKEEERRRASEERRRLERERVLKERRDAEERDRKMNEKLKMIEEQRRKQAEKEEELRRKEKLKWEVQQREHEEDMRARLRRSESIEKAAEAAALVSQRSMNPREFFRQLSSSSSQSPTSPGSSRTGKPLRRYQRSLTDTAFIFSKAEESTASSPRTSPLVSPFSRASPSPVYRATSPPTSPGFYPVSSPQRPRAPMSPPTSPLRPAPPVLPLPSVPQLHNHDQSVFEPKATSPTEPSAPPASPTLFASLSSSLAKDDPSQTHSDVPPVSLTSKTQPRHTDFFFEPGFPLQAPRAPLPQNPHSNTDLTAASHVHTELVSDTGYKVQAVLVEEDEEEDVEEHAKDEPETLPEPHAPLAELAEAEKEEEEEQDEEEEEHEEVKEEVVERGGGGGIYEKDDNKEEVKDGWVENKEEEKVKDGFIENKEEEVKDGWFENKDEEEEEVKEEDDEKEEKRDEGMVEHEKWDNEGEVKEEEEEHEEEVAEEEVEGLKQETEPAFLEEQVEMTHVEEEAKEDDEENNQSEESQPPAVSEEFLEEQEITDTKPICQEIKHETVIPSTNGITNGDAEKLNGIGRSLSPSDTECSSSELTMCYDLHGTGEEDDIVEDEEQEVSENGEDEEDLAEQQMCVRALYDYQAGDESEISFEPGDIIRDVETVDKAWWRGRSKDGRQGLFPANYVETM
ncbi:LOW QUALITY PROTEIN: drebrin [Mugil cephalus]|uniref:LOW QUALITY PROTEIN: drebrin n=1 Tax=Mugil cephalus TaxID=48193 RepID=UPI001FB7134B|nr:LOW QUALITY PROTEIN: drebrin [Mugil cephalus]